MSEELQQSEFGKGLILCLVKFMNHFSNDQIMKIYHVIQYLSKPKEHQELMLSQNPPDNLNYGRDFHQYLRYWVKKTNSIHNGDTQKSLSQDIELWANGASDHLYEIETPSGDDWLEIRTRVEELQTKGLRIGHCFKDEIYTIDDLNHLQTLTLKIAVLIDKKLGLNPDVGRYA